MHVAPGGCPFDDGHCSRAVYRFMGDCVCTQQDWLSLALGVMSILCWGTAELPQIIENYKAGRSEGISFGFLVCWLVGDVLNLLGCILSDATLITQVYTALLYFVVTLILFGQHIWYTVVKEKLRNLRRRQPPSAGVAIAGAAEVTAAVAMDSRPLLHSGQPLPSSYKTSRRPVPIPESLRGPVAIPSNIDHGTSVDSLPLRHRSPASVGSWRRMSYSPINRSAGFRGVVFFALVGLGCLRPTVVLHHDLLAARHGAGVTTTTALLPPPAVIGRRLLQAVGLGEAARQGAAMTWDAAIGARRGWLSGVHFDNEVIASVCGWGMTVIYLCSRLPQIVLNYRRGSVEGLSVIMFVLAIAGNSTYCASIVVRKPDWAHIGANLPWLVDAICCLLLDIFILGQFYYYYRAEPGCEKLHSGGDTLRSAGGDDCQSVTDVGPKEQHNYASESRAPRYDSTGQLVAAQYGNSAALLGYGLLDDRLNSAGHSSITEVDAEGEGDC